MLAVDFRRCKHSPPTLANIKGADTEMLESNLFLGVHLYTISELMVMSWDEVKRTYAAITAFTVNISSLDRLIMIVENNDFHKTMIQFLLSALVN